MSVAHGEQLRALEEHGAVARGLNWWGMIFFIASEALIFRPFHLRAPPKSLAIRLSESSHGRSALSSAYVREGTALIARPSAAE